MEVSVVIVNWNTRDLLGACLKSLQEHAPAGVEVIVVDNASSDGSADLVRNTYPFVKLIEPGTNAGYARGNNLGMEASSGDFILTLNPDTEVFDDTFDAAIKAMKRLPDVGAIGARQVDAKDGTTQRSVRGFPSLAGILGAALKLDRAFPRTALGSYLRPDFDYEHEQRCDQPMGTFLMMRREALVAVNQGPTLRPFDEAFPIFFNEVDLLKRLRDAGWSAAYVPSVRILHHGGEGTKQVKKAMIWESHRSLIRYLRKHRPSPMLFLVEGLILLGAFVRAKGVYAGFRP